MNVRVDLNTPLKDGTEVVFRSPVDCSQVTGLKVYYLGESQEFVFADAHGNNVGDIDHLFAENVVVKVILDVTHGMAFVQNADTNAYLEGRFDDIIDKLCPSFEKTGTLVQCEPVEGYPLEVSADGEFVVTVCGKNLYNPAPVGGYPLTDGYYVNKGNGLLAGGGNHADYCATHGYIPVSHLVGMTINISNTPLTNAPGMAFYDAEKKWLLGGKGNNQIVPEGSVYMRFSTYISKKDEAQIELGSAATKFEEYRSKTVNGSGSAVVTALKGINNVFAFVGNNAVEITVKGKADPVPIIEKLMQAVFPATVSNEEE